MGIQKIFKHLAERKLYPNDISEHEGFIYIDIDGDWKHDHLRCDWLMKELGMLKYDEQETWTDGSDYYGSVHIYK